MVICTVDSRVNSNSRPSDGAFGSMPRSLHHPRSRPETRCVARPRCYRKSALYHQAKGQRCLLPVGVHVVRSVGDLLVFLQLVQHQCHLLFAVNRTEVRLKDTLPIFERFITIDLRYAQITA